MYFRCQFGISTHATQYFICVLYLVFIQVICFSPHSKTETIVIVLNSNFVACFILLSENVVKTIALNEDDTSTMIPCFAHCFRTEDEFITFCVADFRLWKVLGFNLKANILVVYTFFLDVRSVWHLTKNHEKNTEFYVHI